MSKVICMIPARLGSKRVKNKNLRFLDGKPLVAHAIEKAKEAGVFDEIYLNSEADILGEVAQNYGIKFYKRPLKFAEDAVTNDLFMQDFLDKVPCDIVIQINTTSPLITVEEIREFVKAMKDNNYDTLHGVKQERIEGILKGKTLNFDPLKIMPKSQDLEPIMLFSSGIMGWKSKVHAENMKKLGAATYGGKGKTGYFPLKGFSTIDIDEEEDFQLAELALAFQKVKSEQKPVYYEAQDAKLRAETDVYSILTKDGVIRNDLENANKLVVSIGEIIKGQDNTKSWSKRVINTESNSATLISQLPGEGNRLHHHNDWNEWWYIVAGQWEFTIEKKKILVKEGDVVFIEKNKWHRITCVGNKPAVRLAVSRDKVAHIYKEDTANAKQTVNA
ncbi:MAG: CMP-N-acetylneuraminic acid synthetase [Omnitrophica WOR_2 bacterium GWA2_47_8]|nr:MAG: CMP-N-acetylneuraminic acid synthetase [Omnitrophica WOR_2 bacterium GWA2_47_8]